MYIYVQHVIFTMYLATNIMKSLHLCNMDTDISHLQTLVLSELSQAKRDKYSMTSLIYGT